MKPKYVLWLALALAVLLVAGANGVAQRKVQVAPLDIHLTVLVTDPKGLPIQHASVIMTQTSVDTGRMPKEPFHVELKSDEKGVAAVNGFEPGNVTVQIIAKGFQTYGEGFALKKAEETVHAKLAPPKSQITIYHY